MEQPSYYVLGDRGEKYGPADLEVLRSWVAQGRVQPHTRLEDSTSGMIIGASSIAELFPPQMGQPTSPYYREHRPAPVQIDSCLLQSILVTIFCCQVFGIVGIVFAVMADSAAKDGNYNSAVSNSDNARKWTNIGFICGLIANGGLILMWLLMVGLATTAGRH